MNSSILKLKMDYKFDISGEKLIELIKYHRHAIHDIIFDDMKFDDIILAHSLIYNDSVLSGENWCDRHIINKIMRRISATFRTYWKCEENDKEICHTFAGPCSFTFTFVRDKLIKDENKYDHVSICYGDRVFHIDMCLIDQYDPYSRQGMANLDEDPKTPEELRITAISHQFMFLCFHYLYFEKRVEMNGLTFQNWTRQHIHTGLFNFTQ
jgi:hypothetical protein